MPSDSVRVERYFHRTAVDFDSLYDERNTMHHKMNRLLRGGLFERVRLTVAQFQDLHDFDVLDVGCGSGHNSVIFAQPGARKAVGIDFGDNMLELARKTCRAHGVDQHCEFIKGDVFDHALGRKFDIVVALGVFDYIAKPETLLARMMKLSAGKVVGNFPAVSPLRAPFQKFRYALRNLPCVFLQAPRVGRDVCAQRLARLPHPALRFGGLYGRGTRG
jgi:ubiquinone/menaquinone biosynthesis C-methylase UbiE